MYGKVREDLLNKLQEIKEAGLYKDERVIMGHQGAEIKIKTLGNILNLWPFYINLVSFTRF